MARRTLWSVPHWILWVVCVLLVVPTILNVPGNPTTFGLALYLALFASVTHYPVLLPIFAILDFRARRAGNVRASEIYRKAIWVIFAFTIAALSAVFVPMTVRELGQPVQQASESSSGDARTETRSFEKPILYRDAAAVRRLIEAGADIEQPMSGGVTPVLNSAFSENWTLVLLFLQAGADASVASPRGTTVARLARTSRVLPDSEEGRALARVRAVLREQGLY